MLQRATFAPVDDGELAFCYDCPPHEQGMAPFRRLGISTNRRVARYARLQRSRRELEKLLGANVLASSLSYLADSFLMKRRLHRKNLGIDVAFHSRKFDEEFTRLDEEIGNQLGLRSRRGARELNWRYVEDPLNSYRTVTARRDGKLIGYAVLATRGEDAFVIDLLALNLSQVALPLLDMITEALKNEKVQAVYVLAGECNEFQRFLEQCRAFQFRSHAANVVVYYDAHRGEVCGDENWFFTHADLLA